jgi:hypothetical protein
LTRKAEIGKQKIENKPIFDFYFLLFAFLIYEIAFSIFAQRAKANCGFRIADCSLAATICLRFALSTYRLAIPVPDL